VKAFYPIPQHVVTFFNENVEPTFFWEQLYQHFREKTLDSTFFRNVSSTFRCKSKGLGWLGATRGGELARGRVAAAEWVTGGKRERERERGVRLGFRCGSKGCGWLHESQTLLEVSLLKIF
jgi:hypothetical protein